MGRRSHPKQEIEAARIGSVRLNAVAQVLVAQPTRLDLVALASHKEGTLR